MFRSVGKKGQGVSGEFVIVITLVLLAITVMTTYIRRAIQGRYRDANRLVYLKAAGALGNAAVMPEYEPYYVETTTDIESKKNNLASGQMGGFVDTRSQSEQTVTSVSVQKPF